MRSETLPAVRDRFYYDTIDKRNPLPLFKAAGRGSPRGASRGHTLSDLKLLIQVISGAVSDVEAAGSFECGTIFHVLY